MVAFLLTEPQDRLFADPNYAVLLSTITSALAQHDLAPIVMTASTDTERDQALDFIVGHVDGVLLMSSHTGDPLLERLATAGVATVCCGRPLGWESRFPSASADDRAGARAATAHLISGGCRRVATISGPSDSGGAKDRLDGYRDALVDAGMAVDHNLVASGDWSHASGRVAMEHLLSAAPDLDGVFAGNDTMGLGAVAALRAAGRRVPRDVRVVGFDDAGLAATCDPPLTSVRQPFAEISHELVRMLREPASAPIAVRLPTSLIVRESAPHSR
jgi:DNA-binding LacI/PurR family transcriptional regulator